MKRSASDVELLWAWPAEPRFPLIYPGCMVADEGGGQFVVVGVAGESVRLMGADGQEVVRPYEQLSAPAVEPLREAAIVWSGQPGVRYPLAFVGCTVQDENGSVLVIKDLKPAAAIVCASGGQEAVRAYEELSAPSVEPLRPVSRHVVVAASGDGVAVKCSNFECCDREIVLRKALLEAIQNGDFRNCDLEQGAYVSPCAFVYCCRGCFARYTE